MIRNYQARCLSAIGPTVVVSSLAGRHSIECDDPGRTMPKQIAWRGPGWYSLTSFDVYVLGRLPTTSRIKID